jgi:citrate lyase subunit beta/citryl-CoA lyase
LNKPFIVPVAPLFVPGDRPDLFAKAAASGADAIIIDLEDAIAPQSKESARKAACRHDISSVPVILRINGAGTAWHADDLAALSAADIAAVMLPKAETSESIAAMSRALGRPMPVIALIESAKGLGSLVQVLTAPHIAAIAFGSLDYSVDLDCSPDWDSLVAARSEIVLRSRLAGLPGPLDGVTTNLTDQEITEQDAARARRLGFRGKLAIHPRQIGPILTAMSPTPDEIAWAKKVLTSVNDSALVAVDGDMVDAPVIARARRILAANSRSISHL